MRPWSRLICALTAGWLRLSFSAALDMLPVSAIATTVRMISMGMF